MEKQSLICTRKNINTHDSCIFDQLIANVCPACTSDVLQTQTENFEQPKNDSIASESTETSRVFRSMQLHYTAILLFFSSEVLHEIWRRFPWSFDIVVISDVPARYLIFCTKQMRKQSLFYQQHPERHVTFPECLHFPGCMACLCSETPKGVL